MRLWYGFVQRRSHGDTVAPYRMLRELRLQSTDFHWDVYRRSLHQNNIWYVHDLYCQTNFYNIGEKIARHRRQAMYPAMCWCFNYLNIAFTTHEKVFFEFIEKMWISTKLEYVKLFDFDVCGVSLEYYKTFHPKSKNADGLKKVLQFI